MKQTNNKRVTKKLPKTQMILKMFCYTPVAKPLNGSLPQSNASHMLRLASLPYTYSGNGKKEVKESFTVPYLLKGMKGVIRQKIAFLCAEAGLEVCHSTDKEADKHGNKLLPEGFHLLGSCVGNGECILHQIFGSKGNEGIISVYADPIASISHKTADIPQRIQNVHIASENRINLTYEGKTVQDFKERYFSGYFNFEIDVTHCSPEQIGLIIDGAMHFDRLGRGFNSGYGHVIVNEIKLLKRTVTLSPVLGKNGSFKIEKKITEESQEKLFQNSFEAWKNGTHA
ncbi:MAG: hypothetical protein ACFE9L_11345 [Candidatus Hodarchaeota archaeon]